MHNLKIKQKTGFTLIELMIVVAIIGIIAAVAYPSYRDSVIKANRTDGKSALLTAASLQERWFTENSAYTATLSNLGGGNSPEGHYAITVVIGDISGATCDSTAHTKDNCFLLTATPGSTQTGDACANLELDSFGRKTVTGIDDGCW
ncbi:MAG: prepilin-type N-terminal cleavage/methylation domain-containing protein [Aestuariibacter sp.]|nr:prepilin-type N-terminal cleavage/methylation domain-containing protein [Aestuariibacter sp.]